MDTAAEIKKSLMSVLGITPNLPLTATVVSVEGSTCTIKLLDELELSDVRLTATIGESEDGLIIKPKVGSEVIVMSQTGTLSSLMVVKVNEIDTLTYKNADFEFIVDGVTKKVTIKNSQANVGSLINSFIDAISAAVLITPAGPGSIAPSTITALNNVKLMFNLILNTD
jgi:hypothetical protein